MQIVEELSMTSDRPLFFSEGLVLAFFMGFRN